MKEHLVLGSLFAAGVVWFFLRRFRPTLIAAIAIPSSLDRHLRRHALHGLHAQHHHPAGADARGGHRHRRRGDRAREHLPLHGGEGHAAHAGGGRGHAGDRPRRARDHPLADRGVPAGGLHGRHRGPLHELASASRWRTRSRSRCWWPSRSRRCSPRAGSAPKEIEAEHTSRERGFYAWIERAYLRPARLGDGPPLGGRPGHGRRLPDHDPPRRGRQQELPAPRRRVAVRGARARARGLEPGDHADDPRVDREAGARRSPGSRHGAHHRRRPPGHAEPRLDLRQARAGRASASSTSSRSWTDPAARSCRSTRGSSLRSPGHAGGRLRRRQQRRDPVLDRRARPRAAAAVRRRAHAEAEGDPGRGGRRHEPGGRQARAGRADRPGQGRRPGRARAGHRLHAERAGGRPQGHGLLRGRRAVRGAPARRRRATAATRRHRPGRGALAAGHRPLKDVVRFEEGTGPRWSTAWAASARCCSTPTRCPATSAQTVMDGLVQAAQDLKMPPAYSYGFTGRSREQGQGRRATS